jgi:hypothetical protein
MNWSDYFAQHDGTAILSTADNQGKVNAAVYSKPHLIGEDYIALLMSDRLSHANLQSNPHAVYLFLENSDGWQGKRLYLTKTKEERNTDLARSLIRGKHNKTGDVNLVYFSIQQVLPLVGS